MLLRPAIATTISLFCMFAIFLPGEAGAQSFGDSDWNIKFKLNCALPVKSGSKRSIARIKVNGDHKLIFTLRPGDVGGCSTDNQARNHAPYWERAELRQSGTLRIGNSFDISFTVRLPEGFSGNRESFFQIHGWANGCAAYPPVMLMFNGGRLELHALAGVRQGQDGNGAKGQHVRLPVKGASLASFRNQSRQIRLLLDLRTRPARAQLLVDGTPATGSVSVDYAACATPHIKFGVYRPGKGRSTSVAVFDDMIVKSAN